MTYGINCLQLATTIHLFNYAHKVGKDKIWIGHFLPAAC
ncbi:hypothetical protein J2T02_003152 [Chitinophaga terrae (ex Kim and Jung 2007)]|nr:hypothetical protein [Chitinophaga terrae (ex Kim and Jung 2007)]